MNKDEINKNLNIHISFENKRKNIANNQIYYNNKNLTKNTFEGVPSSEIYNTPQNLIDESARLLKIKSKKEILGKYNSEILEIVYNNINKIFGEIDKINYFLKKIENFMISYQNLKPNKNHAYSLISMLEYDPFIKSVVNGSEILTKNIFIFLNDIEWIYNSLDDEISEYINLLPFEYKRKLLNIAYNKDKALAVKNVLPTCYH